MLVAQDLGHNDTLSYSPLEFELGARIGLPFSIVALVSATFDEKDANKRVFECLCLDHFKEISAALPTDEPQVQRCKTIYAAFVAIKTLVDANLVYPSRAMSVGKIHRAASPCYTEQKDDDRHPNKEASQGKKKEDDAQLDWTVSVCKHTSRRNRLSSTTSDSEENSECKEMYCYAFIKNGSCSQDDCNKRHPPKKELQTIERNMMSIQCNYGAECVAKNCIYYHTKIPLGLLPQETLQTAKRVRFPFSAIPYDRTAHDYYTISDPVTKLQRVNSRRGEVGATCVVDLHYQRTSHIVFLLDQVLSNNKSPIPWEFQKGTRFLWISVGVGKNTFAGHPGYTQLGEKVREYLVGAKIPYRLSHSDQLIGGFRIELDKCMFLQ